MILGLKKRQLRTLLAIGIVAIIVAAIAWSQRSRFAKLIAVKQSERHLINSVEAFEEGEFEEALQLAGAAYQLNPNSIEVLRALLSANAGVGSPQILNIAARVFYHPQSTERDRSRCLGIFLETGDLRLFWDNFQSLSPKEKATPDNLYLLSGYYASQGSAVQALQTLEQGPSDDLRFQILRTTLEALSLDRDARRVAQEQLASLVKSTDSEVSARAFRQIQNIPIRLRETDILMPAAQQWLNNREPDSLSASDQLVLPTFHWLNSVEEKNSERAESVVTEVIDEIGDNHPLQVGKWLLSIKLWEKAYQLAASARSKEQNHETFDPTLTALYEVQLLALAGSGKWAEQLELLKSPPKSFAPIRLALDRAIANQMLGRKAASLSQWQEAFRLADLNSSSRNYYIDIYRRANQCGQIEIAVRALVAACQNQFGLLPTTTELTNFLIFLAEEDLDKSLVEMTDGLFRREIFSAVLMNNAVYLRELSGNPVPNGIAMGKHLIQQSPETLGFHTTLVLAHLNREQYDDALAIAERLTTRYKVDELPAAEAIIIAGAYRKSGKKHFAAERDLERKLSQLMDIERRVFEPWFED